MSSYFDFFNRFRSPPDIVKKHQSQFVKYFKECKNVLDIGCGRGEFLELLGENGIECRGVDFNYDMVELCRKNGLRVMQADAITCLESLENGSIDGIFTDDTIEHLDIAYLRHMLRLCHKKLQEGRYLVAKTVNPLSWAAYSNIYLLDTTHKNPLHPEAMRFFIESAGFKEVSIEFVSHVPEGERLAKMPVTGDMNGAERRMAETYNKNAGRLNETVYGPESYAAIAQK